MLGKRDISIFVIRWLHEKKSEFDILNDISDHVTLVQLIDTAGNVNHVVIIIGCCIYYSNYKRALPFIKESLDIIFSPSKDEKGMYAEFKYVYYAIRYVNPKAKSAKTE